MVLSSYSFVLTLVSISVASIVLMGLFMDFISVLLLSLKDLMSVWMYLMVLSRSDIV